MDNINVKVSPYFKRFRIWRYRLWRVFTFNKTRLDLVRFQNIFFRNTSGTRVFVSKDRDYSLLKSWHVYSCSISVLHEHITQLRTETISRYFLFIIDYDSDDGLVTREEQTLRIAWLPVMIDRSALMEMINGVDPLETISEWLGAIRWPPGPPGYLSRPLSALRSLSAPGLSGETKWKTD